MNSSTGGAALSTLGLIDSFRRQGIACCVVCHSTGACADDEAIREATDGAAVFTPLYWWNWKIRAPLWKRPLSEVRQIMRTGWGRRSAALVTEFARKHGAELIHTNTIVTPEGARAAGQLGLPHVWHLREMLGPGQPFRLPYEGPAFGRYMATHCSKLIANSNICARQVEGWISPDLLEVIPNGIDISRFHPRSEPAAKDRVVVAMVGNLTSRWKKHGLLVDAATRVDRSLPIEWRIYGVDPSHGGTRPGDAYIDALHAKLRTAGIADRFTWPGFVRDPAEIMSQIDVLAHSSDNESFGRVLVEAMAAGLPVVGVRGGGAKEIVLDGTTGLLAEPDSADGLARCIEQLVRDPERRATMGTAGRRRAEELYSLEAYAGGVLRVYEAAMARPLGRSRRPPSKRVESEPRTTCDARQVPSR